jgi:hypothetical protein
MVLSSSLWPLLPDVGFGCFHDSLGRGNSVRCGSSVPTQTLATWYLMKVKKEKKIKKKKKKEEGEEGEEERHDIDE